MTRRRLARGLSLHRVGRFNPRNHGVRRRADTPEEMTRVAQLRARPQHLSAGPSSFLKTLDSFGTGVTLKSEPGRILQR